MMNYNWRKSIPELPPLQPITHLSEKENQTTTDALPSSIGACPFMTCTVCEPLKMEDIKLGSEVWFRIGFQSKEISIDREDTNTRDQDFLGLFPTGLTKDDYGNTTYVKNRDYPFNYTSHTRIELMDDIEHFERYELEKKEKLLQQKKKNDDDNDVNDDVNDDTASNQSSKVDMMNGATNTSPPSPKLSQRHQIFDPPYIKRACRLKIPREIQLVAVPTQQHSSATTAIAKDVKESDDDGGGGAVDEDCRPRRLSTKTSLEVWYVDGITHDILARWGPLVINTP
jgi:hypothetical protein